MAGHLLNITITANEALKAANVTVFGITHMMIVTGTTASANVTVNETSPEGDVLFNITAFDLAENNLTSNPNKSKLFKPYNRSHKSNYLKSNHIQQQRPQHITCNLG